LINFYPAQPANAGLLSFIIDSIIGNDDQQVELAPVNSQTIPLLQAAANPAGNILKNSSDITIVNNNAVMSNAGPLGTTNDIEDSKASPDQISIYVVHKGDTISQIADMFDVSVNTIKWANDIKSGESIHEGDILVILPVSGVQYTIKKGDTLKSIAKKFNGDTDDIITFNDLESGAKLTEGDVIIIPNGESTPTENQKTTPPKTQKVYVGYYVRPIDGGRKSQGIHGYNSVDLANSCGTPIYASATGDVILSRGSGWNGGYGKMIIISHPNGTQTLYAHLNKTVAQSGWHVSQGQLIGYVGTTGHSTGCHLHFEIRGAKNPF
jgi:LysM repeat protein